LVRALACHARGRRFEPGRSRQFREKLRHSAEVAPRSIERGKGGWVLIGSLVAAPCQDDATIFRHACMMGLEGIVPKRRSGEM
jgi:hypothetical protein